MPITAADLVLPTGQLASGLLAAIGDDRKPDPVTGQAVADSYAAAATTAVAAWPVGTDAARDAAAPAFAYAAAFSERAQQIGGNAMTANGAGEGGEGYSPQQVPQLLAQAAAWRAKYDAAYLVANPAAETVAAAPFARGSRSTRATVVWG